METIFFVMLLIYCYAGDKANSYCKYHLLNVRAEIYGDTGNYIMNRIFWATVLGWATIPIALIHHTLTSKTSDDSKTSDIE